MDLNGNAGCDIWRCDFPKRLFLQNRAGDAVLGQVCVPLPVSAEKFRYVLFYICVQYPVKHIFFDLETIQNDGTGFTMLSQHLNERTILWRKGAVGFWSGEKAVIM